jgi:hypothetical protein
MESPQHPSFPPSDLFHPVELTQAVTNGTLPASLAQQLDSPFETYLRSLPGGDRQRNPDVISFPRKLMKDKTISKSGNDIFGDDNQHLIWNVANRKQLPLSASSCTDPSKLFTRDDLNGPTGKEDSMIRTV